MIRATNEQEQCRVRSGTDNPCLRSAVVRIRDIPFCEACAREQEAYFAIGELTETPEGFLEEPLDELLDRMQRIKRRYRRGGDDESDAA